MSFIGSHLIPVGGAGGAEPGFIKTNNYRPTNEDQELKSEKESVRMSFQVFRHFEK